jgi:ketosteroid isomerase-like protein
MSTTDNKKLMEHLFSELSKGNDEPFLDAMADDMQWTWMGSGPWSIVD